MRKITIFLIAFVMIVTGFLSGCSDQQQSKNGENKYPSAYISAEPMNGYAPLTVSFKGSGIDTDGYIITYKWDFGDNSTSINQNQSHPYTSAGTYVAELTVIDNEGATGSNTIIITVNEQLNSVPIAKASADRTSGKVPLVVQFTGSGTDPDNTIVSYYWDFDNGYDSHLQNLTNVFSEVGSYNVTLTITNDKGETDTDTIIITVFPQIPEWHLLRAYSGTVDPDDEDGEVDVIVSIPYNSEKWKIEWSVDPGEGYYDNFFSVSVVNDTTYDHHYRLLVNWNAGESPTSGIVQVDDDDFRFGSMDFTFSTMPGTPVTFDIYYWY